jgi:hypothetical protein
VDGSEENLSGLIGASGDGAELFELGEEVFDQGSGFIEFLVVAAWLEAFGTRRDDRLFSSLAQRDQDSGFGIEAFVGDQHRSAQLR